MLGIGRVVGETMVVLMVTGNAPVVPRSILQPLRTLTATIAGEMGETVGGSDHYYAPVRRRARPVRDHVHRQLRRRSVLAEGQEMNGAKVRQQIAFSVLGVITLLIVVPIILVILYIVINGAGSITWQFLTQEPRSGMKAGGIFPAIVGTILLVLGTMLFALPLGVLSAIYLVEYARDDLFTRMIKLSVVNLSGIPSIVYGLFGFTAFVLLLHCGTSILAGSLTLGIMSLPVIITASKEALESVPFTYREISLSLGATKWQTIQYCVLPYAIPGILTGTVLSLSRAAGETAPILFTVAAFYLPRLPHSAFDQVMALPYHLYVIATQVPNIPTSISFATALVLIALVFLMNLVSIILRAHYRKKRLW